MFATVALTATLARAIADLAHGREVIIEQRLEPSGEVCSVSERHTRVMLAEFARAFDAGDWTPRAAVAA